MDIVHRMACTLNHSLYVIDYLKQSFVYVSPDKLFCVATLWSKYLSGGIHFIPGLFPKMI